MVLRLNAKETNPNPHVNFITVLASADHDGAHQLLRALVAQVRPVMKTHGFVINRLTEYQWNAVFAGRNWNAGEVVELVLRRRDGSFCPISWLMNTLCHELAHIKHMNHGPDFQSLWTRLRTEVRQLQDRGYYGDGLWSSGTRLADSAKVAGRGIDSGELPEYICGGAHSRERLLQRRGTIATRKRRETVPSLHTGRQTAKKRKVGARVTSKYAFMGEGSSLLDNGLELTKVKGMGFGKRAGSKSAREERALAIERRLQGLKSLSQVSSSAVDENHVNDNEKDDEDENLDLTQETDAERRQVLVSSAQEDDLRLLKTNPGDGWRLFENYFNFSGPLKKGGGDIEDSMGRERGKESIEEIVVVEDDDDAAWDEPRTSENSCASSRSSTHRVGKRKAGTLVENRGRNEKGLKSFVQSEIDFRKKEALGMIPIKGGGGRILGASPAAHVKSTTTTVGPPAVNVPQTTWSCLVCTLENVSDHLTCSACMTPRGQQVWK